MFHKVEIKSPNVRGRETEMFLDGEKFKGVRSLDLKIRSDEVVTITAELLPEEIQLEHEAVAVFIWIGDKKYRIMECVGDAECQKV